MQRLFFTIIAIVLISTAGVAAVNAGDDPEKILSDIQDYYSTVKTLKAHYVRTTTTPAMEGVFQTSAEHVATGILQFKKPAKLILNQDAPRPETLITNGATVWWYIPEENLVHRYAKVNVYGELQPLLDFLNGLGSLEGKFSVKITPGGEAPNINHRLDLTRLENGGGGPAQITVWCAPETFVLQGFKLTSLTGETTVFKFNSVDVNKDLSDETFNFQIPPGADVVDESADSL
jgi:outer membrane lipoprotein carrier protein